MHEMKKFYYDTAGAANAGAMASLLKLVTSANILFGTDFPPGGTSLEVAKALARAWSSASPKPTCAPSIGTTRCGCCRGSRRADAAGAAPHSAFVPVSLATVIQRATSAAT